MSDDTLKKLGETGKKLDLSMTQSIKPLTGVNPPRLKRYSKTEIQYHIPGYVKYAIAMLIIALVTVTSSLGYILATQDSVEPVVVETLKEKDRGVLHTFTSNLKKVADATKTPYQVTTEVLGGGYVLGLTTYNPEEPTKLYVDYAIASPEKKEEEDVSDTAKKIKEELSADLPTINDSIKLKDGVDLKMETYKMDNIYHTILLNKDQPFAYVITDEKGTHTNYVTSYYVTDIAAE